MELELKIIAADGSVRNVIARSGEPLPVAPGETVLLTPESAVELTTVRDGDALVLRGADGDIRIEGFFASGATDTSIVVTPTALVYVDESGYNVVTSEGAFLSSHLALPVFEYVNLPERIPLPENLIVFVDIAREAALQAVSAPLLPVVAQDEDDEFGTHELPQPPSFEQLELFAGNLDQGSAIFAVSVASAVAREGQSITVTITRSGNLSGSDTIDFATVIRASDADGGTSEADFGSSLGQLRFAPGESSKTIVIALTVDSPSAEAPETFLFQLSNPSTSRSAGTVEIAVGSIELTIVSNDLPNNSVPAAQLTNEDIALVFATGGGNPISVTDADGAPVTVDVSVLNGTLTAGASPPGVTQSGNGSGHLVLTGVPAAVNAALEGLSYQPALNQSGNDTLTISTNDGVATTTSAVAITISPVNDAPVIDASATPVFVGAVEGAPLPVGAVGTAVSALIDATGGGGLNNASDVDGAGLGIAVTFLDTSQGSWFSSIDNGATWVAVGAVSNANSLLLSTVGGRLYFQPTTANFSGTIADAARFRAWDLTSDTNGALVDTTVNGGGTAFSSATDSANITVTNVNDAPVLDASATPLMVDAAEDASAPSLAVGTAVSDLVATGGGIANVTDVDGPALGIAITQLDTSVGQWWFSTNNGVSWALVGAVATNNALLLSASGGRLYFQSTTADFSGTLATAVTFHAWDQSSGSNGSKVNASVAGDPSPFSLATDSVSQNVVAINDAPINTIPGSQTIGEDLPLVLSGGNAISIFDVDAAGSPLTVTLAVGNGTLVLAGTTGLTGDTDGSDGVISISGSLTNLDAALNGLTYQGNLGFSGTDTLNITTSDGGANGAGGVQQDIDSVAITVLGVNNTPVLNAAATPVLSAVDEDALFPTGPVGTAVSALVDPTAPTGGLDNVTDPDGPVTGIAVTALDTSNGQWWFSIDNGTNWALVGAVSANNALLLSGTGGRLYFDPTTLNFNATISNAITFRAWDGFSNGTFTGTNGTKADTTLVGAESPYSTASDTASIVVTAINDAPENTRPGLQLGTEDTPLTFSVGNGNQISVIDVDIGAGTLTVSLNVNNGTLTLAGVAGLTGDTNGSDGVITMTGSVASLNTALNGLVYQGLTGFSGLDTLTITTSDNGSTGAGGVQQDIDQVAIALTGVNDTPVLNAAATPVLSTQNEDPGLPAGAVGTAVSSLVDFNPPAGGLDNVADPDGPTPGIAVTALTTTDGVWWFSINNGVSWNLVGAVSTTNALLLSATDGRLYFQANANFNGVVANAVTFKAWDGFTDGTYTGTNGNKTDTTIVAAESPFSVASDTANLSVAAVNDAPVNATPGSQTGAEDVALVFNTANSNLLSISDLDVGATPLTVTLQVANGRLTLSGAAGLTGDVDGTDGTIVMSGSLTDLNAALNGLTYQGNTDFSGSDTLTITTSDQGNTGSDPGATGGPSDEQDTDTVALNIIGLNDAPSLNAGATPVLTAVNEDAGVPTGVDGTAVSALLDLNGGGGLDNVVDPDGAGLGVAITALNTGTGTWWFSLNNGTSWALVGAVSNTSALLVAGTGGRLYFQPTTLNSNGVITNAVTFRAWDQTSGVNGTKVTTASNGGSTAFSTATDTANLTVTALNDAPVNTVPGTQAGTEDTALIFNAANSNAISIADVDAGGSPLTVTLSVNNGRLALSQTTGLTGDINGNDGTLSINGTLANINAALNGLSYTGLLGFSGGDTLSMTTSDGGSTGAGGVLQDVDTITLTIAGVNNTPTLNTAATPVLVALDEDAGVPVGVVGTAVAGLIDLSSVVGGFDNMTDPDGPLTGIAITALDAGAGTWWFSINNGTTWATVGSVAVNNALLLSATNGRLYYQPNANTNGPLANAVTFKAWDGFTNGTFTGTNGNKADTTIVAAETPFSAVTDTASITVNALNDAPVNTRPGAQTIAEDAPLTFAGGTLISVSDVDAGSNPLTVTLAVTNGTLALSGVAGLTGDTNGADGTISVSGTLANLNAALNGLVFQGLTDFSGASTLTITTSDQGNTGSGGVLQDVDTVAISVVGANDAPVLNAAATPSLAAANEDAAAPAGVVGTAVSALIDLSSVVGGLDNAADPDGPSLGLAITALDTTNGVWWFSTNNGTSWSLVGAVAANNALLLSTTNGRLYFQPTTLNFSGTVANAVTFRAWDQATGVNGTKVSTTTNGGSSAFSTVTDTADIVVTAVNDAPVNTRPGAQAGFEDTPLVFSTGNGNALSVADVDAGTGALTVSLGVNNGTLVLAQTSGLTGDVDGTDGSLSFSGSLADINAALNGLSYTGLLGFSGADTLTITTSDQGNTGTGGALQDVDTVALSIAGVNNTPTLNNAATPVLAGLNEDAGAPAGVVGTAVSALVDLSSVGGGLDNVSDPDGPLTGIAVTALDTANGVWWFSTNNGTTWSLVGAVSSTSALLLSATNGRLYYQSNANFNGTVTNAVTFKAWDGFTNGTFTGTNGTKANTTLVAAENPFSTASDSADITVSAVNDAPVNTRPGAQAALEDQPFTFTGGTLISVADVDAGGSPLTVSLVVTNGTLALSGVAGLTGDTDGSDGAISVSGTLSDLNAALNGLVYQGLSNFSGTSVLTITTSDQGNSGSGGALQDVDTVTLTVTGNNDAPSLNTALTPVLTSMNEDGGVPSGVVGTAVSALVDSTLVGGGLDNFSDPDGPAVGLAVTALDTTNGVWWFSTNNGTSWSLVGAVSNTSALLLSATNGRLYYQPNANFNGTVTGAVTFKAWDGFTNGTFTGTNGTKANTTLVGADSPFSTTSDTADLAVTAVNDDPVNTKPGAQTIGEDLPLTFTGATLISVADVDAGGDPLTVTLAVNNGTLALSGVAGLTGDTDGSDGTITVSGTLANLNAALNGLVFQGLSNFSGASTLTITSNDQGSTGSGGAKQDIDTVAITVTGLNDAPVLNAAATPVLSATSEDAAAPVGVVGTAISSLLDLSSVVGGLDNASDPDGPGLGVAVTGLDTSNGVWWFSNNNGTNWTLVGAVSDTNALLVSSTNGRVYYQPNANFNGTVTNAVTFRAWDQSSGAIGTKVNTSVNGGNTAFSATTDSADLVVTAVNDDPVNTKPGAQTVAEDQPLTFAGATLISVADVDAGGNPLTVTLAVNNGTLALSGVAGLTGDTDGTDGSISVSGTLANLNAALNGLVFQGLTDFSGASTLTITTSDQGNTGSGGVLQDVDTVAISVVGANDAPVLNAAATPSLAAANEDAAAPAGVVGTAVSALIDLSSVVGGLDNAADPDGPSLGLAITALDTTNGVWWFSTNNGTSWSLVGAVAANNALLLSTTNGRLYFQPTTLNFSGTVANAVTFRAWDQATGVNGTKVSTTTNGGSSAFSTVTDTADIVVTAVNDAPVNTRPGAQAGFEDTPLVFSTGNGNALSVADVDAGTGALTVSLGVNNGTLVLAQTSGLTGDVDGTDGSLSFSGSLADINAALNGLSYTGLLGFSGADTLTITTSDQGNTGTGGALQDVDTVALSIAGVNNTPTLNNAATPVLAGLNEDAGAPAGVVGTAVSALVDLSSVGGGLDNVSDPDGPLTGIAVTALDTANGVWWFSTNNGTTWSLVGAVSSTSALLLSATNGRLYYQSNANFNGTVTNAVTFKAWDGFTNGTFTGTNGTKANTTLVAAENPFSTASDSADITVSAVNDDPVNTRPAAQTVTEDTALVLTGASGLSIADADAGASPLTVTLTVNNGTLALAGTTGLTGDTNGSDGTISVSGSLTDLNAALTSVTYQGLLSFSGADTLTMTTSDQGNTGSGGVKQDIDTVAITVTGVNDTPLLNAAATPVLAGLNEDAGAPAGVVGTAVSALVDLSSVGGGLDNVSDPDGPLTGIAVTALDTANGVWWFSTNNGTTWSLVGAVSSTSALLLSATNGRLYYQSNANFNGTVTNAVTFKAWDGFTNGTFTGTNGTKANTTLVAAENPFSTASDSADITVSAVNDAPVNTRPGAQAALEDQPFTFTGGTLISVADVDAGGSPLTVSLVVTNGTLALSGVAGLTGDTDGSDGAISVSGTLSDLNAALNGLVYQGLSNFSGTSVLTITTSDQGNSGSGGALQDVDTVTLTVTGNNDAPSLNTALTPVLTSMNEDGGVPSGVVGTAVSALVDSTLVGGGLDNFSDPDGPAVGLAVTALDTTNGVWWFSTNNGTSWSLVGAVSNTSALLLSATNGRLYYQPNANFNGTVTGAVTFKAWDGFTNGTFTGTNGTKANTTLVGADSPFSTTSDTADLAVTAVNDDPVNTKPGAQTIGEDLPLTFTGATLISVADVDAGGDPLTVTLAVNNGTLALSGVAGLTGDTDGSDGTITVSGTLANLNAALNGLVFQGLSNFSGASTLTITSNDQGSTGSGGAKQDIDTVAITVTGLNDAPVLNAAATPVLSATSEDAAAPVGVVGTAISSLLDLSSVVGGLDNASDPDGPGLGVAVTGLDTSNGVWWFSNNNGTNWTLVGAVSDTNALLVSSTNGRVYYQPNANFNGTVTNAVTFRAWDQSSGAIGTKVNTSVNGGNTAFSATTDSADLVVTAVNDDPVNTKPGAQTVAEDQPLTFAGATLISVADVDAGGNPLTVTLAVNNGTLALSGVAGLTGDTDGTDGSISVSGTLANLNAALNGLVFQGLTDFSGASTLTITTSDQGNTGSGGVKQDVDTVAITVTGVNNTPTLNNAATPVLAGLNEDAGAPAGVVGTAVSALVDLSSVGGGLDNVSDPDGPLTGIAVTALDTANGVWWFSTNNGTTWSLVGAVSSTSALLLSATNGRLYYQSNANFNGTVTNAVTFKAWDGFTNGTFTGTNGTKANTTLVAAENPFSTASDSADITVSAVNDAPVNTRPGAQAALEDQPFTFTGGTLISVADVDAGGSPLTVSLVVTNGTLALSGVAGLTGDTDGSDGAISVSGTLSDLNAALNGLVYQGLSNFSGTSVLTITTSDQGNSGSGGALQDVDTVTLTVTGNNDAPSLNTALTPVLTSMNEDGGVPSGVVGTAVSALVDSTLVGGGLDNFSDPDGPAVGLAVTALDTTNGVWWFSTNNGTSWSLVGAVSNTSALLLSATNGRLYYQPNANFNGTVTGAVTFKAWDGFTNGTFTGTNGTKANTTLVGADSPFSAVPDTADLSVSAINDAPVNTRPGAQSVNEDQSLTFSGGASISVADIDAGGGTLTVTLSVINGSLTLGGTAGLTGDTNGSDGTISVTGTLTNLNSALGGLIYQGLSNFSGADTLTITTSDLGNTGTGGALQDVDTVSITVIGDNDAPVLNAAATPVLVAVNEDAVAPAGVVGTAISSLLDLSSVVGGLDNASDPDGPGLGVAVTGLDTSNGVWWFSNNNGTNWTLVGAVSDTNALLVSSTNGRLYYQPNANFNGTVTNAVTFRAWDQSSGAIGTKVNTSVNGGTTAFSTATDTAAIVVNALNDAPVNTRPGAQTVAEATPLVFNGPNVISVADIDAGGAPVRVTLSVAHGSLSLSSLSGLDTSADPDGTDGLLDITGTLTSINAALNGLIYLGATGYSGPDTLTMTSFDLGNSGSGGALQDADTVAITVTGVNDTPVLDTGATPVLAVINEDAGAPAGVVGTAISTLVDLSSVGGGLDNLTDPDGPLTGIAVTALDTTNGTWWFSTNNGTSWSLVGAVSNTSALLLSAGTGRLYYQSNANFNGTVTNAVTFKVWDGFTNGTFTGTNGTKFNTTLVGAENPFSSASDTADITVTAVNDAPTNSVPGAQAAFESTPRIFNVGNGNAITVADADLGPSDLAITLSVTNGTLTLGSTAGLASLVGNGTGTVTFLGTVAEVNNALSGLSYLGNTGFSGADTLTITTNDQGSTGSGGALQDVDVIAIAVAGVNDTPTLNATATPVLVAVNEDGGAPSGIVGTAISNLVDLSSVIGGLDNVADPDGPLTGIAVTALDTSNGTWWFSTNNGTSWTLVGAVSTTNALLLSATNGRLYFEPNANFNGNVANAVTFKAWDGFTNGTFTGTNGTKANTTLAGGESPFSAVSDTASIAINAVNDAPVNTRPGAQVVIEDQPLTFSGGTLISIADADAGVGQLTVNLSVSNGTLTLSGTTGLTGDTDGSNGTLSVTGSLTDLNAALNGLVYQGLLNFNGADTLSITTNDLGNTGSGGALQDVDTVAITVNGTNDAPSLNAAAVPVLAAVNEGAGIPVGAIGTTVASLIDLSTVGGGLDNATDPDGPSLGIAITALDTTNGSWWFSTNNGTSWTVIGAVANNNALLLSATNGRLYFQPGNADFNGTVVNAVTFRAWDQATGTNGTKVDTGVNGGTSAFSTATDTASIAVSAVNDAPVNSVPVAQVTADGTPLVFNVANGNAISLGDVDAGGASVRVTLAVANGDLTLASVTGLGASTDLSGTDGTLDLIGTLADINAALDGLRYDNTAGFGGSETLAITSFDLGNTGSGGSLQDSDNVAITVTGVNDTPVLSSAPVVVLNAASEDASAPSGVVGTAVANMVDLSTVGGGLDNVADPDGPLVGIAITALDGAIGTWWFSTNNGTSWAAVGLVSATNALLLSATNGRLYFQPTVTDFNGTITNAVTFKAWDGFTNGTFTGTNGTKANTTLAGAESPFSATTDTADIAVTAVNDAPVNTVPGAQAAVEDTARVFSAGNGNAITVNDVDLGAGDLSMTLSVTNGTLTLGSTAGLTSLVGDGTSAITFLGSIAEVNAALSGLSYLGTANFNGSATLTVTTNDQGATGTGGTQQDSDVITINVAAANDSPVLNNAVTPTLNSVNENAAAPAGVVGTSVSSLADLVGGGGLNNITDIDNAAVGVALTALDATNGTWWFSINNGTTWATVGTVSDTSALLLSAATGRVYFQPNASFNGTVANAITFRAWDTSSGTQGSKVSTTGAGTGTSAFSAASDVADQVVAVSTAAITATIVLNNLNGTEGLKLNGVRGSSSPGFSDFLGFTIAGVGDVNRDGRADLIIGARDAETLTDSQSANKGRAYIVFGNSTANLATLANGTNGFNLNLLNGTQGIALTGAASSGRFSNNVDGGGDHNGDGIADILTSEQNFAGGNSNGYVIYGDSTTNGINGNGLGGLNNLLVTQLIGSNTSGANDVNSDGVDDGLQLGGLLAPLQGTSIANGGDLDNDGIDDIVVGNAERDTTRGTDSGEAFVVFGASSATLDGLNALGTANGTNVLSFFGQGASDFTGFGVSGLGDIDHDGFDDFALGATGLAQDGKVYVVFGDTRSNLASLASAVNTSGFNATLNGANGFRLVTPPFAPFGNLQTGAQLSAIGDFNGDMIDDFAVSSAGISIGFVIFGKAGGFTSTIDLTAVMNTRVGGFAIAAGLSDIAGAGDVNGDGLADVIVGSLGSNEAYVLYGTSNIAGLVRNVAAYSTTMVDLTDGASFNGSGLTLQSGGYLNGKGLLLDGVASSSAGAAVDGIGDFNGDGFDDIAVGAFNATTATSIGNPAGQAYVVYGADYGAAGAGLASQTATAGSQVLRGGAGVNALSSGGFSGVGHTAGAGNDVIRVNGTEFGVNGGGGLDILTPDANGISLNFDALTNKNLYANIEQIQLDGFGANTVQLDLRDVLEMSGSMNELLVTGDNGTDTVQSSGQGWLANGTTSRSVLIDDTGLTSSLTFNVYSHAASHATLLIEQGLNQSLIS